MDKIIDIIMNFDINNIKSAFVVSIVVLVVSLSCIDSMSLSKIELLLVGGNHSLRSTSFVFSILLGACVLINCVFIFDKVFIPICILYFFVALILYGFMKIMIRFGKCRKWFDKHKEEIELFMIITLSASIILIFYTLSGGKIYCIIFGSLIETIFLAMYPTQTSKSVSKYYIEIEEEKWYLIKRINKNLMLLGNLESVDASTKVRMIPFDDLLDKNIVKNVVECENTDEKTS